MNNIKRSFLCLCMLLCALSLLGEEKPDALALFMQKKYAESVQVCLTEMVAFSTEEV